MSRVRKVVDYTVDRLCEPSTWQAIGFVGGCAGSKFLADMDYGAAAVTGGVLSAVVKAAIPDGWKVKRNVKKPIS